MLLGFPLIYSLVYYHSKCHALILEGFAICSDLAFQKVWHYNDMSVHNMAIWDW